MKAISHRSHPLASQRRQARPIRRQRRRPNVTPRVVLHLLVGALTLVSAQALLRPMPGTGETAMAASVAYADQQNIGPATIVAPSLSTSAVAPVPPLHQVPDRSNVMTDLSATIGQSILPVATTWRGIAGADVNRRQAPNRSRP